MPYLLTDPEGRRRGSTVSPSTVNPVNRSFDEFCWWLFGRRRHREGGGTRKDPLPRRRLAGSPATLRTTVTPRDPNSRSSKRCFRTAAFMVIWTSTFDPGAQPSIQRNRNSGRSVLLMTVPIAPPAPTALTKNKNKELTPTGLPLHVPSRAREDLTSGSQGTSGRSLILVSILPP